MTGEHVLVVGASLAGLRAGEALRREGFDGRLTLLGAEEHFPPYDRPPLSKEVLSGKWEPERARLRLDEDLDADLLLGERATSLDLAARSVTLASGHSLSFGGLVVATGASPRRLRGVGEDLEGVFVLRTIEDCLALDRELGKEPAIVVVGGGFIGSEVASVCRQRELAVTVVEALEVPMERALGPRIGAVLAGMHRDHGVDLRLGVSVVSMSGGRRVERVTLSDGSVVPADVVLVATGVVPETGWLEGSGLVLDDGLLLDETCMAVGADGVVAAGDVARWHNPLFEEVMRVEHWDNANEQAEVAVTTLLHGRAGASSFDAVPYFWSDQHGNRLQFVGIPGDEVEVVEGSVTESRFVAAYGRYGRLVGVLCMNWPARTVRYRRLIAERAAFPPRVD